MRHTKTGIINTALMRVGAQGVPAAFQDAPAAQTAAAAYDRALDCCLALHPWNFAVRYAALAQRAGPAAPGWRHAWSLPADCLRIVEALGEDGRRIAWTLSGTGGGETLHTRAGGVTLCYVSGQVAAFPSAFADALAWRVAVEIAPYVQQGGGRARDYLELFERALDRARTENDLALAPERAFRSAFLAARMVC